MPPHRDKSNSLRIVWNSRVLNHVRNFQLPQKKKFNIFVSFVKFFSGCFVGIKDWDQSGDIFERKKNLCGSVNFFVFLKAWWSQFPSPLLDYGLTIDTTEIPDVDSMNFHFDPMHFHFDSMKFISIQWNSFLTRLYFLTITPRDWFHFQCQRYSGFVCGGILKIISSIDMPNLKTSDQKREIIFGQDKSGESIPVMFLGTCDNQVK